MLTGGVCFAETAGGAAGTSREKNRCSRSVNARVVSSLRTRTDGTYASPSGSEAQQEAIMLTLVGFTA